MRLSSFITQAASNYVETTGTESNSNLEQGLKNGMEAIMGKMPGQSITGEVLASNGNEVLIALGRNQLLQAKLEGSMSPQLGQLLTFQIQNNSGGKVVLTPLFENLSNDPNVSKALQAAGLPENDITRAMVSAMMEEGMPVDRQSLYQMNRLINANPQVDILTLIQMQRLQLPITEGNIIQFEAYKNYQHQLSQSLMDITDAFAETFQQIAEGGDLSEGLSLYQQVLDILTEGENEAAAGSNAAEPAVSEQTQGLQGEVVSAQTGIQSAEENIPEKADPETELGAELELSREELDALAGQMRRAGLPESAAHAVANNRMSGKELLSLVNQLLSQEEIPQKEELTHLLQGKEFKTVLKNEMGRQWLLPPEDVAEEGSVDKLYQRLSSQLNRLSQVLTQSGQTDTPLARTVTNTTSNLDFMNQLNQAFTYVQIPLKMHGGEANGELFVYTNKKSLARKDGSVSALLHLDMEYLGSVDVHVSMVNQKVATKFYLQDDAALDLIADNIHILNERLEQRGYSMNAEFINKESGTNVMEEILKQDKNISVLSGSSFDARA